MKKRTIISVLTVLCLITCCFVGSTYAKFSSTVSATGSATVASWAFQSGDNDLLADSATIALETTVNTDTNVNTTTDKPLMAPGTTGSFSFNLKNTGDVTATAVVTLSQNADLPAGLTFGTTADGTTTSLASGDMVLDSITLAHAGATTGSEATVTIYWSWAIGDSGADNDYAGTSLSIEASVLFEQVD